MAEEKKPEAKPENHAAGIFSEMIGVVIVLFILMSLLSGFSGFFGSLGGGGSSSWFSRFSLSNLLRTQTTSISSLSNPIGAKFMVTSKKASLYDSPGGKEIGTKKLGDEGTIIAGPTIIDGEKYWQVKFEDGSTGWIKEDDIGALPQKSGPLSSVPTLLGGRVATSKTTPVFDEPGGNQIAEEKAGSKATIVEGPLVKDGVKYWHVKFDDGTEGWVAEGNLNYLKLEKQPLSSAKNVKKGDGVIASKNGVFVFDELGGKRIGIEDKNAKGEIVDGPKEFDGEKYWKISFDDGVEGWVKESDLDYVKETPVALSSMPSLIGKKVKTSKNGAILYDSPGGNEVGTKNKNTSGKIIEGPIIRDGVKYWHVEFDDGTDGWVREDDLDYVEDDTTFLFKFTLFLLKFVSYLKYIIWFISGLLILWIIYLFMKINTLASGQRQLLYPEVFTEEELINPKWQRVLEYSESLNENDWRLAILEADIMLADLLETIGYFGETIGDKLKNIEKSDFTTLDNAWEAHKVRNEIAHQGSSFLLSQREVKRVIGLYKTVFEEFEII